MSSWLDQLPSQEKEKIRKRLRSPEEYERLREKVKGPEDLEREMEQNAEFAEVQLMLESEKGTQEKAKNTVKNAVQEQGIEASVEGLTLSEEQSIKEGNFKVIVSEKDHQPTLAVTIGDGSESAPSGNVSEVYPLKPALQKQVLATFTVR